MYATATIAFPSMHLQPWHSNAHAAHGAIYASAIIALQSTWGYLGRNDMGRACVVRLTTMGIPGIAYEVGPFGTPGGHCTGTGTSTRQSTDRDL